MKERINGELTGFEVGRTFAEFFSGIGLMRLGLEASGWQLRFANDIDPEKCKMYRAHFPDAGDHLVESDIHELDASSLPTVALATASFPCNDLSIAGAMKGLNGKQSSAFWGFVRLLQDMGDRKPPLILIENVVQFGV
jgi:DNA (cytosine-5)-methyltransferase 1